MRKLELRGGTRDDFVAPSPIDLTDAMALLSRRLKKYWDSEPICDNHAIARLKLGKGATGV
jgi:hypothetical protein